MRTSLSPFRRGRCEHPHMHASRRPRVIVGVLLACAVAASASQALASSAVRRVRITDCTKALVRPSTVTLTCGDGGVALTSLRWSSFGGPTAVAAGRIEINLCEPNCAAGHSKRYAVTIIASRPKRCNRSFSVYSKVKVTFTSAKPRNAASFTHSTLSCPI
jgi:hypothetical protein